MCCYQVTRMILALVRRVLCIKIVFKRVKLQFTWQMKIECGFCWNENDNHDGKFSQILCYMARPSINVRFYFLPPLCIDVIIPFHCTNMKCTNKILLSFWRGCNSMVQFDINSLYDSEFDPILFQNCDIWYSTLPRASVSYHLRIFL